MLMLEWFLLAFGVVLFGIGILEKYSGRGKWIPLLFFVLGFLHLYGALFLFAGGIAPYGALTNSTVNTSYTNYTVNETAYNYDNAGAFTGSTITTLQFTLPTSTITTNQYSVFGEQLTLAYIYGDGLVFFLIIFFVLMTWLVGVLKKMVGAKDDDEHENLLK